MVAKVGDRLIEVGASDFLKERLRAKETKLRELRHARRPEDRRASAQGLA